MTYRRIPCRRPLYIQGDRVSARGRIIARGAWFKVNALRVTDTPNGSRYCAELSQYDNPPVAFIGYRAALVRAWRASREYQREQEAKRAAQAEYYAALRKHNLLEAQARKEREARIAAADRAFLAEMIAAIAAKESAA